MYPQVLAQEDAMKAIDVMTRAVVSIRPDASILDAARLMLFHKVSGLPVVDSDNLLVGIVTEGDFLRRPELGAQRRRSRLVEFFTSPGPLAEEYIHASGREVQEIMSTELCIAAEDTALSEVAKLMEDRRIKRVPVLRGEELVGIATRAGLLRAVISLQPDPTTSSRDDAAIHQRLLAELKKQPWAVPLSMILFTVRDGVVEFSGVVRDERQRKALRVAAESIPGVQSVSDLSLRVEPVIGVLG
jgi:CBS domain-containing protein